ncbi:MAG: hypothetical protein K2P88_17370 [Chitinophagaceae bacterium]|nr:hypothetical protein [Chitinophagaceae bacterium]
MIFFKTLVFFNTVVFFSSCVQFTTKAGAMNIDSKNDTFRRYVYVNPQSKDTSWSYREVRKVEKLIGLKSIQDGFDSLQIRIWIGYSSSEAQLVMLSRQDGVYSARLYHLRFFINEVIHDYDSVKSLVTNIKPKSQWDSVIAKLISFDICSLPDSDEIENYPIIADGRGVIIETSTKKNYRFVRYLDPAIGVKYNIKEAEKVVNILNLLQSEFTIKYLNDHYKEW